MALHVGEEQRRSAGGDHAPMNLGDLEVGIDGSVHRDEIVVTAESIDERAEIGKAQMRYAAWNGSSALPP